MVLLVIGIGLMLNSPWAILVAIPLSSALHLTAISPEENYLEGKFGDVYRAYRDKVPRWFSLKRFFDAFRAPDSA
jgi:protein-S-isoprenylcysteine O-methyltransferase Ste14